MECVVKEWLRQIRTVWFDSTLWFFLLFPQIPFFKKNPSPFLVPSCYSGETLTSPALASGKAHCASCHVFLDCLTARLWQLGWPLWTEKKYCYLSWRSCFSVMWATPGAPAAQDKRGAPVCSGKALAEVSGLPSPLARLLDGNWTRWFWKPF